MKIKLLFKHTTSLLRSALLLGAVAFINIPTQAQTAGLPDAFETMDPATIIGDGKYYYIQFYESGIRSYLSDHLGNGGRLRSKDFLPFAKSIQWTLEGSGNQFKLKSRNNLYVYADATNNNIFKLTTDPNTATTLTYFARSDGGYEISIANDPNNAMYRHSNGIWADIDSYQHNNAHNCLRIAKIKNNTAYIIYYQDPIYKAGQATPVDPNTDTRAGEAGFTQHHYLTYSGTDASNSDPNFRTSTVSSRSSILTTYDSWLLPTAAAYHQDGLWTLEEAGNDGEFYIKKYGTDQYLNPYLDAANFYYSVLGAKDVENGKYRLEFPNNNRYTRIQSDAEDPLTQNMFKYWDGYGANATSTGTATVDFNVGNNTQLGPNAMVAGTSWVDCRTYADLTNYSKMTIKGTQGMQLRVLMSRQVDNSGPMVEKDVTIGSDGKAVVDLTNLELNNPPTTGSAVVRAAYIDGYNVEGGDDHRNICNGEVSYGNPVYCGVNKISGGAVQAYNATWLNDVNIAYLQVDASAIQGTITRVTLKGDFRKISNNNQHNREMVYGVGYNNSTWSNQLTWNTADRSITTLGSTQTLESQDGEEELSFDITDAFTSDKIKTILVYNLTAGTGYIKNPRVEVEYYPSVSYAHLNAIKTGNNSPTGTITSITMEGTQKRYLHRADGDGWEVFQWSGTNDKYWNAGFLPVEVTAANNNGYIEDQFYQVLFEPNGGQMIGTDGSLQTYSSFNPALWTVEQFGPNADYQHYRMKNFAGKYYNWPGSGLVDNAPTSGNGVFSNTDIIAWKPVWLPKTETRIPHEVTHKVSNVKLYYTYNPTDSETQKLYSQQGLITNDSKDWQNTDGTQKVNEFKITHYVKKGETLEFGLPTTLGTNNDHKIYQRWYHYQNDTDIDGLKNHFNVSTSAGTVMDYLYNNGMVTGVRVEDLPEELQSNAEGKMLYWPTVFPGTKTYVSHLFKYNNSDGQNFILAADVSRYNDFTYQNSSSPLDGNLEEPSLTMRYIFEMKDAKVMADELIQCTSDNNIWLEEKTIHFPARTVAYESSKSAAYQGEFIGIRHIFRDYWVYNGSKSDDNLISAVINNTSGYINVVVEAGNTGITKGGKDNKGYYLYDEGKTNGGKSYGDSRFVAFKYPNTGEVSATGETNPAYVKVYFTYGGVNYQIAKFKIIFDAGTATLPWTSVNSSAQVKGTERDPKILEASAGKPIAKITFDYPTGATFKNSSWIALHNKGYMYGLWSEIQNSSPLPLTFDNTNYGFDGDNPSWGSYAMVTTMPTRFGNVKTTLPADHGTYGYNKSPDGGMQSAFLYIDASEQPGDICSIPFYGEFCSNDLLMCSGWISGSNKVTNDDRCPGSVTITVKGERTENGVKVIDDIYRFCPGQCYELDNGTAGVDGSTGADHVVWQQFYFEFNISTHYDRQWMEVNNNCVSSTGGDFMLDNIEVYAIAPEVEPEMNTPLCVNSAASEMQLMKMSIGFDKLIKASGVNTSPENTNYDHSIGIVFLKKDVFLKTFQSGLSTYNNITISLSELETNINNGVYKDIATTYKSAYEAAFDAALLGSKDIWNSNSTSPIEGAGLLNFHWSHKFSDQETYSFAKAVNGVKPIFGYSDSGTGERFLVMNGNSPKLPWELNTVYYIVTDISGISSVSDRFTTFNICSDCTTAREFQLTPPYKILSMETSNMTQELEVCEGKIPTLLTDLRGYNYNGVEVPLTNLNFDWWLGDLSANPKVPATIENYHLQKKTFGSETVRLDEALSYFRVYYADYSTLDGVTSKPDLTDNMITYLKELVNNGQLVLHQKSISYPAVRTGDEPYFYVVACPIHDGYFDQALNHGHVSGVSYYCDEPQGLRMKLGEKAPTLKTGFVPNENGFPSYAYPTNSDPVLSIRLAKAAQFETVQHGTVSEDPEETYCSQASGEKHFLWLPIRNAKVQSTGSNVVQRATDHNIYLASTNDPTWDKEIYNGMNKYDTQGNFIGSLPIIGKIVKLYAIDTEKASGTEVDNNRLCIYFTSNFEVREGYNYTLSLPFKEAPGANTCDGTILINMKIVPDYEVWTGAAGNTDWNNDENWRRADGNTTNSSGVNGDELYRANATADSPLYGDKYMTNYDNYRSSKDRIFRKGFAPLYCTHVLMKNDEWGNAPVLYDALDGKNSLTASPFPNLRDEDNWNGQGAEATATPILRYDMQARLYDIWSETYGSAPASNKGRSGDLLAEMYQVNSCDEIAFQPGTELRNAHLLNYNTAWVEYQLDNKRWYLLGSPLQGTIAGEWYAPTGTAQQKTTYYDPVTFGPGYDRYSPAIYQRSWDKAKAVLYEIGSVYNTSDDSQTENLGSPLQGQWGETDWNSTGADDYLDRLGYKPMGGKKANVAIKGVWSNTYNDATVDYATGGFSVMVMNHLKNNDQSGNKSIIRLPKEDKTYYYYQFTQDGSAAVGQVGTETNLAGNQGVQKLKNRAKNRGRLKTDLLLPEIENKIQRTETTDNPPYGDARTYTRVPTVTTNEISNGSVATLPMTLRSMSETVSAGISNLGYYLVENPFPCGLNMNEFFSANTGLVKKYWLLTDGGQQLVQWADGQWVGPTFADAEAVVAPGQGFFVQATTAGQATTITYNKDMQAQSRFGKKSSTGTPYTVVVNTVYDEETDEINEITEDVMVYKYVQDKVFPLKTRGVETSPAGLVITAQRDDNQSSALVMQRGTASNDFLPEEDTETFITSDLQHVPTIYTLCGRLATTINSIHDFRSLGLGVESNSDAPCTLTFDGVEMLGDSIAFYDAVEKTLTPLESGTTISVSGQTQNRYYLVRGLNLKEAAEETHLQIFTEGLTAKVIASTAEPILVVRCFDTAGRLLYTANPDSAEHSFTLPGKGIYIIEAQTENDRKTKKVMTK